MRRVPKRKMLAFALLVVVFLLFAPYPLLVRALIPSRLTVHAPPQWRSIKVDGVSFPASGSAVRISPLGYGPHLLSIELANGRVVRVTFFHADAGMDRRVDVYVDYLPQTDTADVRQTITRYETLYGVTRTVFTGSIRPEHTNEAIPLQMDWI